MAVAVEILNEKLELAERIHRLLGVVRRILHRVDADADRGLHFGVDLLHGVEIDQKAADNQRESEDAGNGSDQAQPKRQNNLISIAKRDQRWRGDNDIGRFGLADEGNVLISPFLNFLKIARIFLGSALRSAACDFLLLQSRHPNDVA
ncbi:hypothetical protein [Methylovirgula ligni]|uniref:hypothetical protein n=1 Tax=Methylovirgula ligni TaxID=569860 RepID=UPI001AECF72D|nr:hypothetical protein [Methylovirgula ligni]